MIAALDYDAIRADTVRHVAKLMAAAAVTAPKSGGQLFLQGKHLFIETVIVDDHDILRQLAGARGKETPGGDLVPRRRRGRGHRRRAGRRSGRLVAAQLRLRRLRVCHLRRVPPRPKTLRDHSAEFEFAGPTCNVRDIDLGIAVGSAAKTAAIHSIDCRAPARCPSASTAHPAPVARNRQQPRTAIRPNPDP